jgi:membrane protein
MGSAFAFGELIDFGRRLLRRLLTLEVVDRSLVVGAQAFSALVPLFIVLASVGSDDGSSFADTLIRRYHLGADAADAVRSTFASPASSGSLTLVGITLVVFSSLAFTRALQRTFELTWDLERRGMRSTGWGLLWLGFLGAYVSLFPAVRDAFSGGLGTAIAITGSTALWLITPYLLLARRIAWRRLIPQAALTVVGMTALSSGLAFYAPRAMANAAKEFGAIGVAFTLLTILWAAGFVLVTAAGIGSSITLPAWPSASPGSVTPPSAARRES